MSLPPLRNLYIQARLRRRKKPQRFSLLFFSVIKVSLENTNLATVVQKVTKAQIRCYSPGTASRH